ncbi:hypothetical protein HHI36_012345 [Cryptolaemus montrouzieri]|uniref:Uncharacterized protein n=1 Tax=Cryptolaemus montrouzieri TaxID=559131 RepID=A0ABD2NEC1_9CUCU
MNFARITYEIVSLFNYFVIVVRYLIRNGSTGISDSLACLVGKTAIVTGGNEGIGFATSMLLASRGCKVIIACRRDASKKRDEIIRTTGNPNVVTKKLDLASLKAVRSFAEDIEKTEDKIDILINNAGVGSLKKKITEDGLNATMQTNFFGAFLLTHLLLEPLKSSENARIVFVSSGAAFLDSLTEDNLNMVDYEQNNISIIKLYCHSKFCNILAAQEFGRKLKKYNISVNSGDTGTTNTNIFAKTLQESPVWTIKLYSFFVKLVYRDIYGGAQTSFHLATSEKLKDETGQHYFRCKRFVKPQKLKRQDFCDTIWKKSEELVCLKPEEKL